MHAEELSRLVEMIYDCAVDPGLWRTTLESIAEVFDSPAATLAISDDATGSERSLVDVGISNYYRALYRERFQCDELFMQPMMLRLICRSTFAILRGGTTSPGIPPTRAVIGC